MDKSVKSTRPLRGYFAAVTPAGYIWCDTISWRAREARQKCGKMFVGMKRKDGTWVESHHDLWAEARSRGFRLTKVDVQPRP